ncbi:MAG: hypothetical protein JW963_04460 [Anaerolineales bacterium]|nr:hypothetical protein [Anaerolineales bacterium]
MSEQVPPQTPDTPAPPRPRRAGPNWSLIMVLFGVAAALFVIGIKQSAEPLFGGARLRWRTANAVAAIKEWETIPGTRLYGEPEITELEGGSLQIVATFAGEDRIEEAELTFTCGNLPIPVHWTMESCAISPTNSRAYSVTLRRD